MQPSITLHISDYGTLTGGKKTRRLQLWQHNIRQLHVTLLTARLFLWPLLETLAEEQMPPILVTRNRAPASSESRFRRPGLLPQLVLRHQGLF